LSSYTELVSRSGDTSGIVEDTLVVGDNGVTGPLREDTQRDEDGQSEAVTLGAEEISIAAVLLVLHLHLDGISDLTELELNGKVLSVTIGVVLGKNLESLLMAVLGNEESRRFGDPYNLRKV
jgi:hypothetical protein